jgi:hypothetical protein
MKKIIYLDLEFKIILKNNIIKNKLIVIIRENNKERSRNILNSDLILREE